MDAQVVENIVEVKEFEYSYQAKDELGRPLGGVQIFKGATVQEVLDKVADANRNLIRLNRELNRRVRLGEFEKEELPSDAVKLVSHNLLQPRELTIEEKSKFARDILDPEKFDEVNRNLIEAQLGAKPEDIRNRINNQEQRLADIEARQEAEAFAMANSDYYVCVENFKMIASWIVKNNLSPVRENFQLAYDTLKAANLILEAPVQTREIPAPVIIPPVVVPVEVAPVIPVVPIAPRVVPSGLTRELSSDSGTPPNANKLTRAEVEKMPSDVYKRRLLTDKSFAKQVNELYAKVPNGQGV